DKAMANMETAVSLKQQRTGGEIHTTPEQGHLDTSLSLYPSLTLFLPFPFFLSLFFFSPPFLPPLPPSLSITPLPPPFPLSLFLYPSLSSSHSLYHTLSLSLSLSNVHSLSQSC